MLEEKSMPKFYWAKAVRTDIYIQNRIGDKVSAHELYFGRKPNLRHFRIFGSIAYVHVLDEKRRKLDPKSEKCIVVGQNEVRSLETKSELAKKGLKPLTRGYADQPARRTL